MQEVIENFTRTIITQKGLSNLEPEVLEQLVQDMSARLSDEINKAILMQLNPKDLKNFEVLISSGANNSQVQSFLSDKVDTTEIATNVMQTFSEGYLGKK